MFKCHLSYSEQNIFFGKKYTTGHFSSIQNSMYLWVGRNGTGFISFIVMMFAPLVSLLMLHKRLCESRVHDLHNKRGGM